MTSIRPKRRCTTHVERLHGELCVYEWTTKTVHALNPAAARVWERCDGVTTIDEMSAAVRRDVDAPGAMSIVEHALAQFDRAGLLEPGTLNAVSPLLSRRALLRRIGAAAAIPVVTSIVAPTPLAAQSGGGITFNFTGAPQSFTVPEGVMALQVDVIGASGGGITGVPGMVAGVGGRVQAALPVTPGEALTITVGGEGASSNGSGGFNGGGSGGNVFGGGGASDIRRGSARLIVAGGGGASGSLNGGSGGPGGGLIGGTGTLSINACGGPGGGGTQSAGGAGASGGLGGATGSPGTAGQGGNGGAVSPGLGGGGGGGGYFGGGGGGGCLNLIGGGGPGGGGSSFTDSSATSVVHTQGFGGSPRIIVNW